MDPDGDPLTYEWTDPSGELIIANQNLAWTTVKTTTVDAEYGVETKQEWLLDLEAADCGLSDTDQIKITVVCTGEN